MLSKLRTRRVWIAVTIGVAAYAAAIVVPLTVRGGESKSKHRTVRSARAVVLPTVRVLPKLAPGTSLVAESTVPILPIYGAPGRDPMRGLRSSDASGAPVVLLVKKYAGDWLQVYLPTRPNGSTGWVHRVDTQLAADPYRVVVDLSAHQITVTNAGRVILQAPVGVGRALTPTPNGLYFIVDELQPSDPTGPYGPYAFGLSAHSTVLDEFEGGNGQIGIHGTDDPGGIGSDVSHGCVRVTNDVITALARQLPLGTPVLLRRESS